MPRRILPFLLIALSLSGTASIVNQVAWQRGLKVFLGGSESLSSMTVVLVFMLGLGVGSGAFALRASLAKNPLRALGAVEIALCVASLLVGILLSLDVSESVYTVQRAAITVGVPLRALYVAGALLVFGMPCFLMGITIPLSSEVCQRQLGGTHVSLVNVLLFANTSGAVLGALASGFLLLPRFGQLASIGFAATLNAAAGILLVAISWRTGSARQTFAPVGEGAKGSGLRATPDDVRGFFMGLLALAYEMYLFRAMVLGHQPLPYTFAAVLSGFLAAWALGTFLASRLPVSQVPFSVLGTASGVAVILSLAPLDRWTLHVSLPVATITSSLPVVGFGLVYGGLAARSARSWGSDLGRFGAWNTAGACAGILLATLVGYELAPSVLAGSIAAGLVAVFAHAHSGVSRVMRIATVVLALAFPVVGGLRPPKPGGTIFAASYSRDGVVEVERNGNLIWDGLWHSKLASGRDHLRVSNWILAVAPVLVHQGPVEDALVVGAGAGITVGTLAKIGGIRRVDAYEINHGLQAIYGAFPDGTLRIAQDPRVRILWQDGRSGLALREKKYDLVTQQPLYLEQAGSSLLLSQEYFRLVKSRLKPGGVFAIYSFSRENAAQAHLVRETAASVFEHHVTFDNGYLIVASSDPIVATVESFRARIDAGDELAVEMGEYESYGYPPLIDRLDDGAAWSGGGWLITDDHPLVEYPRWASALVHLPEPEAP